LPTSAFPVTITASAATDVLSQSKSVPEMLTNSSISQYRQSPLH
jgi:hypothetical protein